jgi:pyruvate dehydrogenase E2 component (dihydrolipoamide acetyltransferase)/2-oxoisovalerate dehydrogenase E2 component (dihydrolipoyl transacylase)
MDFPLPQIGEGVYEAELVRWLVKVGDAIKHGQPLLEVMTDKATSEVPSPFVGTVTSIQNQAGDKIRVGETILTYTPAGSVPEALPIASVAKAAPAISESPRTNGTSISPVSLPPAAPSVRHLARQMGIDLKRLQGSGPGGRILIDDLSRFLQAQTREKPLAPSKPPFDLGVAGSSIKLHGLRKRIAEQMVLSSQVPQYTYVDECDLSELVHLRKALREPFETRGLKLTYLPFIVKAVVQALKEVPLVNSTLDESSQEIRLHAHYHIGIAVATPSGLMVPVVRDADRKDLLTLTSEIDRLGNEAKSGRAKLDDLRGSTFTVTSIGSIGGLIATPILNVPEVGIVGIGKLVKRPIYDENGKLKPAEMVYLSFTFDHRVVDGAIGAIFGNAVLKALFNPAAMLIG